MFGLTAEFVGPASAAPLAMPATLVATGLAACDAKYPENSNLPLY